MEYLYQGYPLLFFSFLCTNSTFIFLKQSSVPVTFVCDPNKSSDYNYWAWLKQILLNKRSLKPFFPWGNIWITCCFQSLEAADCISRNSPNEFVICISWGRIYSCKIIPAHGCLSSKTWAQFTLDCDHLSWQVCVNASPTREPFWNCSDFHWRADFGAVLLLLLISPSYTAWNPNTQSSD